MKAGLDLSSFKKEFSAIRHGDYHTFIRLIKGPVPTMVIYSKGEIRTNYDSNINDIDFAGLIKSGPSLLIFYQKCIKEFGELNDSEINDDIFEKLVLFEIGLRMHANNENLLRDNEHFVEVINKISLFKKIAQSDIDKLQRGRDFINMVKHRKMKFPTWSKGIEAFLKAYEIQNKYKLTVI